MGVSLIPKLEGPGVEPDNLPAGKITLWFGLLTLVIVVSMIGTWQYTAYAVRAEHARKNIPDDTQLKDVRAKAQALLNGHGPVEGQTGMYRIPIKRAMRLLAGKPGLMNMWPKTAPPKTEKAAAPATAPTAAPATAPTAATAVVPADAKEMKPASKPSEIKKTQ